MIYLIRIFEIASQHLKQINDWRKKSEVTITNNGKPLYNMYEIQQGGTKWFGGYSAVFQNMHQYVNGKIMDLATMAVN